MVAEPAEGRVQSLLARWDSLGGRTHAFGEFLQLEGGTSYLGARLAELDHAEPRHVRELVARWLAPSRARFLVLEPSGATGRRGALTYAGGAEAHEVRVDPALADRPLPVPGARAAMATERFRLDNGLTVVLWPHGKLPLVHGRLVVDSGSAHEPESGEGVSLLVGADEVTPDGLTFTGLELATHADRVVAEVARLTLEPFHRFVARELDAAGQVFGAFGHGEAVRAALAAAGRPP